MPDRPNILYVFADQMRASAMGCMDDEPVKTPNLDRLAGQGMLFRNAIANTPVCTPSRASLITGRHALTCRCIANDIRLPEDEVGIASILREHGYRCGYVGKWHLDGISRHMFTPPGPRRHGFDNYWAAYNCNHNYFDPRWYEEDSPELKRRPGFYDADVQTDQAIGFLEGAHTQPFCLFLSWGPPHDPYRAAPSEFLNLYPPERVPVRPNAEGVDRTAVAGYYAHVSALDRNVGRLMAALDRLDLAQNTIFVFSSDHGDMLWSQGRLNKQQPYEESIHIPLIVRWPERLPAGRASDLLIGVVDHAPTLLGLAGVGAPAFMNGLDLSAHVLRTTSGLGPQSALIANHMSFDQGRDWQPWRGLRTRQYTYVRWLQGGTLLYDNLHDPYQLTNLALERSQAGLIRDLEADLQHWLAATGDDFLPSEEHIRRLGQWQEWQIRQEHFYGVGGANW